MTDRERRMPASKQPREVAGLGRPETPEETATRKAEARAKRRANQTFTNLVFALVATLLVVLVLVLVVVRTGGEERDNVDYQRIAEQADPAVRDDLVTPSFPEEWWANDARLRTGADDVTSWYVGLIDEEEQAYLGYQQGLDANPTWLLAEIRNAPATGTLEVGGVAWTVHDQRDARDAGNYTYVLSTEVDGDVFLLYGTASDAAFEQAAAAVVDALD